VSHAIESKRILLETEAERYFGETCVALAARWERAIVGLAPPLVLRELGGCLQGLEGITDEANCGLMAAYLATISDYESADFLIDRALASVERLNEMAKATIRRMDELLEA